MIQGAFSGSDVLGYCESVSGDWKIYRVSISGGGDILHLPLAKKGELVYYNVLRKELVCLHRRKEW